MRWEMAASAASEQVLLYHEDQRRSHFIHRLLRVRLAGAALLTLLAFTVMAVGAPLISPYDPIKNDLVHTFISPSWSHPFGTDYVGRDVLSRVIYGARIS